MDNHHSINAGMISLHQVSSTTATQRPDRLRSKGFVDHVLLQDISTTLRSGEIIGIVGATGAGKTSLLRLLNRLTEPTTGHLSWQGERYDRLPTIQLRQQIMLVPQEVRLLGMTVRNTIVYGLQLRNLPESVIQTRLSEWQQRLHIPNEWLDKTEVSLSLGERQWVTIGRGLICESPVLLLDEPTAHLDQQYAARLQSVLSQMSTDRLVVVVSHDVDWLASFCQRVLYLEQGRLVQDLPQAAIDWSALKSQVKVVEQSIDDEWCTQPQ
jgi:D-methionine transport system ATP-binding protein